VSVVGTVSVAFSRAGRPAGAGFGRRPGRAAVSAGDLDHGGDCEVEVHAVAVAVLAGGGVDREPLAVVAVAQRLRVGGGRAGGVDDRDAVLVFEPRLAVCVGSDRVAALVYEPVVAPAEQEQVGEARLAAVAPVPDVVGIDEASAVAAREAAAAVTGAERPPQRRRDRPAL